MKTVKLIVIAFLAISINACAQKVNVTEKVKPHLNKNSPMPKKSNGVRKMKPNGKPNSGSKVKSIPQISHPMAFGKKLNMKLKHPPFR